MSELPMVSVIVPVWNGAERIGLCLAALSRQTYPHDRTEVIVVDNGSTDGTLDVVAGFAFARVLHEPKLGSYNARNTGIGQAVGEFIAFTDGDCIPDPEWLARAVDAVLLAPDAGVISGQILLFKETPGTSETALVFEQLFAFRQDRAATKGLCATANWLSRKSRLLDAGGFDGTLKSGADGRLSSKIQAMGHPVVYVHDMVVRHPVRGSVGALATKRRRLTGGRWERTSGPAKAPKVLATIAWDTARRLKDSATARDVPVVMRMRIAGLVLAMAGVAAAETVRLSVGGRSSRA